MSTGEFVLSPYPGLSAPEGARVSGRVRRDGAVLAIDWRLVAPVGAIALADPATRPERRVGLWDETCFEFFLASPEQSGYREFNLSPAGHWNVFRFDGYRAGMQDEAAFEVLPFSVASHPGICEVTARIDTTGLGIGAAAWRLAIATVLTEPDGRVSYWALAHPGLEPDFHHAEAFVLGLEPSTGF